MGADNKKTKITIIDDEKSLVDTIKSFLEERGFEISVAYDGKSGLETIEKVKPDLIILDIMMPNMDGRDVLARIKRDVELKRIPVIMLTVRSEQFDRTYGLKLGAHEYISKPYDSYRLLRQINNILKKTA